MCPGRDQRAEYRFHGDESAVFRLASGTNPLMIRPVFMELCANDPEFPRGDCSMTEHKYQIGEDVHLERSLTVKGGMYVVTKLLPEHDGEFQYRIKSAAEPHERVVRESQLTSRACT